jgi:uncharacterized membrane protein YfcA
MPMGWTLLLGLFVGALSGLLGIGGGVLLIPGLMFLFGFSQQEAQGTTLAAMIPPIGLFAAIQYHRQGFVNPWAAAWIAIGFAVGAFLTAGYIKYISPAILSRAFGALLLFLGVRMILQSHRAAYVAAGAVAAWICAWFVYMFFRGIGLRHGVRPHFRAAIERSAAASPPDADFEI